MTIVKDNAPDYRPEIDGLRALAVIPVILFHAGFNGFRGGFIGVDVFFVISGYLITTQILNDKKAGKFTIAGFYERRARRILPALFFVMMASLIPAWLWMLPDQAGGLLAKPDRSFGVRLQHLFPEYQRVL